MASHGAIVAAVIGAVATVAATVLAVVLPKVLADDSPPSGGSAGTTIVTTTKDGRVGPPPTTTTTRPPPTTNRDQPAEVFANKESAPVGATVLVSGRRFAGGESVDIRFGAHPAVTTRAAASGEFANVSVTVPEFFRGFSKPMTVEIVATGKSSIKSARVAFTISG